MRQKNDFPRYRRRGKAKLMVVWAIPALAVVALCTGPFRNFQLGFPDIALGLPLATHEPREADVRTTLGLADAPSPDLRHGILPPVATSGSAATSESGVEALTTAPQPEAATACGDPASGSARYDAIESILHALISGHAPRNRLPVSSPRLAALPAPMSVDPTRNSSTGAPNHQASVPVPRTGNCHTCHSRTSDTIATSAGTIELEGIARGARAIAALRTTDTLMNDAPSTPRASAEQAYVHQVECVSIDELGPGFSPPPCPTYLHGAHRRDPLTSNASWSQPPPPCRCASR